MALTKTIQIDGQDVTLRASAAIPRIYRIKFNRDIYRDLAMLQTAVSTNDEGMSNLDNLSLEMFENIAYIMAKHADPSIPDTPEEWLDPVEAASDLPAPDHRGHDHCPCGGSISDVETVQERACSGYGQPQGHLPVR